jgi:translation initiation factor 2D
MAVGKCEIDVSSLGSVQGMKGHAVSTFHWAGDELWSWSPAGYQPGSEPPGALQGWNDENDDAALATQTAGIDLRGEREGGIPLEADPTERSDAEKAQGLDGEDPPSFKDAVEVVDDTELSQKGKSHLPEAI